MNKSHLFGALYAGVVMLLASVTVNAAIVYNLNRTIGDGTVTGFIETDGTIGVLSSANITDWVLTLTAPNLLNGPTSTIDFTTSQNSLVSGSALTASNTALSFDFSTNLSSYLFLRGANNNLYCLTVSGGQPAPCGSNGETIGRHETNTNSPAQYMLMTGNQVFAVASVPVPAAVWLFGSGLLGLVGMARRKKAA